MVLETISQIFFIIGSIAGLFSLCLHYKDSKKHAPIIHGYLSRSHYEVIKEDNKSIINISTSFLINNTGLLPTSIYNTIGIIYLNPEISGNLNYNAVRGEIDKNHLPLDIKANGTTKVDLSYTFQVENIDSLNRCLRPSNPTNPEKWERDDLPIALLFLFKHTHGQFNVKDCIFRIDQPEYLKEKGNRGLAYSEIEITKNEPEFLIVD